MANLMGREQPYMGQGVRVNSPGSDQMYSPMGGMEQFWWDLQNNPGQILQNYPEFMERLFPSGGGALPPEMIKNAPMAQNPPPPQMPGYDPMGVDPLIEEYLRRKKNREGAFGGQ